MNTLSKFLMALALLSGSVVANADMVTYTYTGIVNSATGVYSNAGATVSGTFTIDIGAAMPLFSYGTVGQTSSGWYAQGAGGISYGTSVPAAFVFTSTLNSCGVSYSSAPASYTTDSYVGGFGTGTPNPFWNGAFLAKSSSSTYIENYVSLTGAVAPWDANGLPLFGIVTSQHNFLDDFVNSTNVGALDYTITSLTPVPLPASAWLMLAVVGCLGLLARRRTGLYGVVRLSK